MNINPDDWTPVVFPDEIELHDFFDKWNGIAIFSHTTIQKVEEHHSFMRCKRYAAISVSEYERYKIFCQEVRFFRTLAEYFAVKSTGGRIYLVSDRRYRKIKRIKENNYGKIHRN